jgi:hypothetical protein
MTAEIAVINKQAVALAADSAVTLPGVRGVKIYNTVNKLFTLSKYEPVGIMIYGSADLCGLPLETAIKEYRSRLGRATFGSLGDYADHFIKYLEESGWLFPQKQQRDFIEYGSARYLWRVKDDIDTRVSEHIDTHGNITDDAIREQIVDVISQHERASLTKDLVTTAGVDDVLALLNGYSDQIDGAISFVFEELPVQDAQKATLRVIVARSLLHRDSVVGNSGVVIAGFGTRDVSPCLREYSLRAVITDKLHYQTGRVVDGGSAGIYPFAQTEMVATFVEGVSPAIKDLIGGHLEKIAADLPAAVIDPANNQGGATSEQLDGIRQALTGVLLSARDRLLETIDEFIKSQQIDPLVNNVAVLPKHELAEMAEALVSLTSFKQRVTPGAETVGGPVDVAVISKGDGFIWIKRKHYFKPELNHHFFSNYFNES